MVIQTAILIALYTLGGALTVRGDASACLLEWLCAGLISTVILAIVTPIVEKLPLCLPEPYHADRSVISLLWMLVVALLSLEVATDALDCATRITAATMLREAGYLLPLLLLVVPAYLLCRHPLGLLKFAPLALLVALPILLILSLASFDMISVKETMEEAHFSLEHLPLAYVDGFAFVGLTLLCVKRAGAGRVISAPLGALVGGLAGGMILLQICTLLGSSYAVASDFPYAEAVSAVTIGGGSARPDGLGYALMVLCTMIRLCIAGDAFIAAAEPFFGERRLPNLLFFTAAFSLCIILGNA